MCHKSVELITVITENDIVRLQLQLYLGWALYQIKGN